MMMMPHPMLYDGSKNPYDGYYPQCYMMVPKIHMLAQCFRLRPRDSIHSLTLESVDSLIRVKASSYKVRIRLYLIPSMSPGRPERESCRVTLKREVNQSDTNIKNRAH